MPYSVPGLCWKAVSIYSAVLKLRLDDIWELPFRNQNSELLRTSSLSWTSVAFYHFALIVSNRAGSQQIPDYYDNISGVTLSAMNSRLA